ncbi:flavonol 7-O-beta-glucosyltransferase UGT74F1 [Ricinus communis]|uniref:Glycosyltransferase n=1 Tax=Ricinus communis TaxID=3988 RepID=B9SV07_RICCO|nr:flavonol 7-O-beta-glucosyltransferase UGT74F1 [Ricinus communis]EEF32575.1 UDP-glucosyltransferase, putative [Ricinus communis]|eukprot:XP_002529826.1 UDP-glycosyltransferase 74F1 [Ricinus communis]
MREKESRGHVLVIPFPGQGHLNPMLQFSRRLVSKGLQVTFIVTTYISRSKHLVSSSNRLLQFDTISDGYDEGGFEQASSMGAYLSSIHTVGPRTLKELIAKYQSSSNPIDCLIYEPFLSWALDIAKQFGLIAAAFFTHACAVDYVFYSFYRKMVPVPDVNSSSMPVLIEGLPPLELQDLPTFIVLPEAYPANAEMIKRQFSNVDKADYILVNTFYKLEYQVVDTMSTLCPLLTIGPTIPSSYSDKRIENEDDYGIDLYEANASIPITWLSTKPTGSVVYVSFGSIANNLSEKQMEEVAWGLKRSNFYFLWVVKNSEEHKLPKGYVEEVAPKGLIVNWSPQVKILTNESIGCFFTHCGWNSTIEALSLGVPMVTLPQWSDQPTNSKFVEDVWRVGIRVKVDADNGIAKRDQIEYCIKEVMESVRGKEMKENSKKWKELAVEAISEGGTSDKNIDELVFKVTKFKSLY